MIKKFKSLTKKQWMGVILAIILIVAGVVFAVRYVRGTIYAYHSMQFAMQHNFDAGNPDVELLEPWMSMRYIAEAYTVPQSFLFDELGLEMNPPNSELPVGQLNRQLGRRGRPEQPIILGKIRDAILKYRENPIVTGLQEQRVARWMSVQYIANSTGIPADYIFEQIGLPMDGYAYMPLPRLADEAHYEPGDRELARQIQEIIDNYEAPSQ